MAGIKNNLRVLGVVGALAVLAILGIAVPAELWTLHVFAGVAVLALTVVLPFFVAPPLEQGQPHDAQEIWLIGPVTSLYFWLISVSVGTIALALLQHQRASLVGVVVWAALFLIGYFGLNAASKVVRDAASQTIGASEDARTQWAAALRRTLYQSEDDQERKSLEKLLESLRYCANNRGNQVASENEEITNLISRLEVSGDGQVDKSALLKRISALLVQRDESLKAARSHA